jgi:hypothetical protein
MSGSSTDMQDSYDGEEFDDGEEMDLDGFEQEY